MLIHKFHIWTISVWSNNYFDKGPNLLFSEICQLICLNFHSWYDITSITPLLLNSPFIQHFNSIELAMFRKVL